MDEPRVLPCGDLYFDGEQLSINGEVLSPGVYAIPGTESSLFVADDERDDDVWDDDLD